MEANREKTHWASPGGHQGMRYDLEINTDSLTPEQAADRLIKRVHEKATHAGD